MERNPKYKITAIVALMFCMLPWQYAVGGEQEITPEAATRSTQIVIIASSPFITDMQPNLSPGHLRAALKSVRPNIIAADVPTNEIDGWKFAGMDTVKVVKPWAIQNKVKIKCIGYNVADYKEQIEAVLAQIQKSGKIRQYKNVEDTLYSSQKAFKQTFKFINSSDHDEIWRSYHQSMQRIYKQSTPWQDWNAKIAENLIKLGNDNPGKRIAVVISAPHCYYLKDAVLNEPNLQLINIEKSLDFSMAQVKENTEARDHLNALRLLTFDEFGQLHEDVLTELETHLQRLYQYPEFRDDAEFFRGKMFMHRQKYQQAIRQFTPLTYLKPNKILEYDSVTPVRDASMIYSAVARIEMGDYTAALRQLFEINQMQDVKAETREWANRIIQNVQANARN